MAVNCFRFFGINDWQKIDQLTIKQYRIMMKAFNLKQVDEEFEAHRQAYLNYVVKAEKQLGKRAKPVYDKFEKFYDYESRLKEARDPSTVHQKPKEKSLSEKMNEFYKNKKKEENNGR